MDDKTLFSELCKQFEEIRSQQDETGSEGTEKSVEQKVLDALKTKNKAIFKIFLKFEDGQIDAEEQQVMDNLDRLFAVASADEIHERFAPFVKDE